MKMAGVIGGMGPSTTAEFYNQVNKIAENTDATERPELMLWNIPLNYEVERKLLETQQGLEQYLPTLLSGAKKLEKAGADFLVMPCNTVHGLYDQVIPHIGIPFLHIIDETVKQLQADGVTETTLFATGETIQANLYQGFLNRAGIACIVPDEPTVNRINHLVSNLVKHEKAIPNQHVLDESKWFNDLALNAADKVGSAVLGCTDLQLAMETKHHSVTDSMLVLAQRTVDHIYS